MTPIIRSLGPPDLSSTSPRIPSRSGDRTILRLYGCMRSCTLYSKCNEFSVVTILAFGKKSLTRSAIDASNFLASALGFMALSVTDVDVEVGALVAEFDELSANACSLQVADDVITRTPRSIKVAQCDLDTVVKLGLLMIVGWAERRQSTGNFVCRFVL